VGVTSRYVYKANHDQYLLAASGQSNNLGSVPVPIIPELIPQGQEKKDFEIKINVNPSSSIIDC
jgi:hypothetical protein